MNRKDWLLLVIGAARGELLSPVQLQKSMFLLKEDQSDAVGQYFYKFVPYAYGPFCIDLYRDAEELEQEGLVSIHLNRSGRWREYRITPDGAEQVETFREQVNDDTLKLIEETVNLVRNLSFHELVREIYKRFPEYRKHSVFQGMRE